MSGFDRKAGSARLDADRFLLARQQDQFRGFLESLTDTPDNAVGLREKIDLTDVYVDSHLAWSLRRQYGSSPEATTCLARARTRRDLRLRRAARRRFAPVVPEPTDLPIRIEDRRQFFGGYSMLEWRPTARLVSTVGCG